MSKLFLTDSKFKKVTVTKQRKYMERDSEFDFIIVDNSPVNPNERRPQFADPWSGRLYLDKFEVLMNINDVSMRLNGHDFVNLVERMQSVIARMQNN